MRWLPVLLLLISCGERPRTRCERSCSRLTECVRELRLEQGSDWGECVEECNKLERELSAFVDEHVRCVDSAVACQQIIDCP